MTVRYLRLEASRKIPFAESDKIEGTYANYGHNPVISCADQQVGYWTNEIYFGDKLARSERPQHSVERLQARVSLPCLSWRRTGIRGFRKTEEDFCLSADSWKFTREFEHVSVWVKSP
ncbi:MAG: hypothetical protein ACSHX4_11615 [Opitutaceae bacterium]